VGGVSQFSAPPEESQHPRGGGINFLRRDILPTQKDAASKLGASTSHQAGVQTWDYQSGALAQHARRFYQRGVASHPALEDHAGLPFLEAETLLLRWVRKNLGLPEYLKAPERGRLRRASGSLSAWIEPVPHHL
jgi:hypothetical protein